MPSRVPQYKPPHARLPLPVRKPVRPRSEDAAAWKRFIDSRPWKKLSAWYRKMRPACEWCLSAHDILVPVAEVHHMRGHDPEFALDPEWLYGLCKSCHSRVTLAERRGQAIEYPPRPDQGDMDVGYA